MKGYQRLTLGGGDWCIHVQPRPPHTKSWAIPQRTVKSHRKPCAIPQKTLGHHTEGLGLSHIWPCTISDNHGNLKDSLKFHYWWKILTDISIFMLYCWHILYFQVIYLKVEKDKICSGGNTFIIIDFVIIVIQECHEPKSRQRQCQMYRKPIKHKNERRPRSMWVVMKHNNTFDTNNYIS